MKLKIATQNQSVGEALVWVEIRSPSPSDLMVPPVGEKISSKLLKVKIAAQDQTLVEASSGDELWMRAPELQALVSRGRAVIRRPI